MCNIEVFPPTGIDESGNTIGVAGTVSDCPADPVEGTNVTVEVACGEQSAQRNAEVFSDGRWYAEFPNLNCRCGRPITATATCTTVPDCEDEIVVHELPCIDCSGQITDDDVLDTTFQVKDHECLVTGNALVPIEFTFKNTLEQFVHIHVECGPNAVGGASSVGIPSGVTTTQTMTCEFQTPTPPQEVVIWFLDQNFDPIGCPPVVLTVDEIEECPCNPGEEPDISVEVNGCDATFTRTELPDTDCTLRWNFDDGSQPKDDDDVTVTHTFPKNGTYNVAVAMICGDCTYPIPFAPVDITECVPDDDTVETPTDNDTVAPPTDDDNGGLSFLCVILAIVWAITLAAFLALIAAGAPSFAIAAAASALAGLMYWFIDECGFCAWAWATVAGVTAFLVALVVMAIMGGAPNWWQALIAAIGFVVSAVAAIFGEC